VPKHERTERADLSPAPQTQEAKKLGLATGLQAVIFAYDNGLIQPESPAPTTPFHHEHQQPRYGIALAPWSRS